MKYLLIYNVLLVLSPAISAQELRYLDSSKSSVSFRGMSVVNENTIWVSGSSGTICRTTDGGKTWQWVNPKGFENRDFRDIHGYDDQRAIALAIDSPGLLIRSTNGGQSWQTVYRSDEAGIFLDALDFEGPRGIAIADPINGRFRIVYTLDSGKIWRKLPNALSPEAKPGEALFAASGQNLLMGEYEDDFVFSFVTGGTAARLFVCSQTRGCAPPFVLPIVQGGTMTGANGMMHFAEAPFVFGGNYERPDASDSTLCFTDFTGQPAALASPIGYVSSATSVQDSLVVLTGLKGVAVGTRRFSNKQWTLEDFRMLSNVGFHTSGSAGKRVYLAGSRGRIALLIF